jgi:PKD repeat protein
MPLVLRRAIANGLASVAVALFSLAAPGASAQAKAGARVHAGPIGGITLPSAPGARATHHSVLADSELYGGPGTAGTSPGGGTPPLLYGGGPVMHGVTAQVVAWAPPADPFPSGYVSGYEQYLADMSTALGLSSNISSVAAQYVDASGSALSSLTNNSAITDTDTYPSSGGCTVAGASVCLTESQILTELSNVISAHTLPVDESHSYIVLLPPGVDSCFDSTSSECEDQAFCGYHTAFTISSSTTTFTLLPYTESTYSNAAGQCYVSGGPSALSSAVNAVDSIGAHELFESATDPLVGSGYVDSTGEEIGDECAWTWGSTGSASGGGADNQVVNGRQYLIQEMWSNQAGNCKQGASSSADATISLAASPVLNTATSFSVALSGDSSAASSYEWSYTAPNGSESDDVSSSASPSLTFTSSGTYTVWAAVTDAAGGTITAVKSVTVASTPTPTANFSFSSTTSVPAKGSAVSFTNSSTASSSQSITASSWNFGDGWSSTSTSPSHTYTTAGTYTVTLRVTQTNGQQTSISKTITITSPPSASISWSSSSPTAGVSQTFTAGGSAGAGSITANDWSFGDGSTSTSASPSHAYATAGTYTVTPTVTQTDGLQTTVTHSITVATTPPPPTVSFTNATTAAAPTPGTAISFTSSATAGRGSITGYSWSLGDGASSTSASPSHTYSSAGSYTVTLTVTETGGVSASVTHTVTVTNGPSAAISWSPSSVTAGSSVTFSAGASAGAGSISTYSWNFGDGSGASSVSPAHTYSATGTHTVTLTVTQSNGLASTVSRSITVAAAVVPPPTVSFSETTTAAAPTPSAPVSFISTAKAGSGSITAYNWNFGNGATANVANPSHTFLNAGTYTVTLTVTQTGGLTASKTVTLVVATPPSATFSWTTTHTLYPGTAITFKPTATAGAGAITAYSWNFADGSSSTATSPSHSFARSNSYNVTLTVTQADGLTTTVQKTVLIAQPVPTTSKSTSSSSSKSSTTSSNTQWSPPSSWLVQTIQTASSATKIGDLLHANGSKAILTAPQASGQLVITWRVTQNHRSVVIARSKGYVLAGVTPNVAIRLTRAGRRLLARQRQVKVAAQAIFRSAKSASKTTRKLTLTR